MFLCSGRWFYPGAAGGLLLRESDAWAILFWETPLSSADPLLVPSATESGRITS